jgi:hypothetical protein
MDYIPGGELLARLGAEVGFREQRTHLAELVLAFAYLSRIDVVISNSQQPVDHRFLISERGNEQQECFENTNISKS